MSTFLFVLGILFLLYGVIFFKKQGFLAKIYSYNNYSNGNIIDNIVAFSTSFLAFIMSYTINRHLIHNWLAISLFPLGLHIIIFSLKIVFRRKKII